MRFIFAPEVEHYLIELVEILFHKEYFGFYEDADEYVTSLVTDITTSLSSKQKKTAPGYFSKYGKDLYYSVFKKNNHTQWYVFFNLENDIYYIRYIGNNHMVSQHLS
jgi:hypothetical protein